MDPRENLKDILDNTALTKEQAIKSLKSLGLVDK